MNTKLYQEDFVSWVRPTGEELCGFVARSWRDVSEIGIPDPNSDSRPLKQGEVIVSFLGKVYPRGLFQESMFTVLDRLIEPGDVCKRNIEDSESAIVDKTSIEFRACHNISEDPIIAQWFTKNDVEYSSHLHIGDYVIYDDWIGQIVEMYDETIIEDADKFLVRKADFHASLHVGDRVRWGNPPYCLPPNTFAPARNIYIIWIFLILLPRLPYREDATVVKVNHIALAIGWTAINQQLPKEEAARRPRPQRFWRGKELTKLTILRGPIDREVRVGEKIQLKNPPPDLVTLHGNPWNSLGYVKARTFLVDATRTMCDVIWQDGRRERIPSSELIPYTNPDEYDHWPGEHVIWVSDDGDKAAVVQSVNAVDRTASLQLYDGTREVVPLFELACPSLNPASLDSIGVHRGDYVLIHPPDSMNGALPPKVPRVGELEEWTYEPYTPDGQPFQWHKEFEMISKQYFEKQGDTACPQYNLQTRMSNNSLNWCGEVQNVRTDGMIEVSVPDDSILVLPLNRLSLLNHCIESVEGDGEAIEIETAVYDQSILDADDLQMMRRAAMGHNKDSHSDSDMEEGSDFTEDDAEDEMDIDDDASMTMSTQSIPSQQVADGDTTQLDSPSFTAINPNSGLETPQTQSSNLENNDDEKLSWKKFEILPEAPADHTYYSTKPSQPSKNFMARLNKEYRVLSSSLPDTILVRAYENRADLLRCMIIGPENTPYEDAPFVIDWQMAPDFPQSPPTAFFLSWTNGNGRVNPNLYEEGKVCLSILGTWAGDKSESWSPSRSSLLQAFVSIQGLVLVKEPWFCEPAYEKLRGTDEATVNSRLYSEKAYILSRGFVLRALQHPPGGFEDDLKEIYYTHRRLEKVVLSAKTLVERSGSVASASAGSASTQPQEQRLNSGSVDDLAVPRLTAGGIKFLSRTLEKLDKMYIDSLSSTTAS